LNPAYGPGVACRDLSVCLTFFEDLKKGVQSLLCINIIYSTGTFSVPRWM